MFNMKHTYLIHQEYSQVHMLGKLLKKSKQYKKKGILYKIQLSKSTLTHMINSLYYCNLNKGKSKQYMKES